MRGSKETSEASSGGSGSSSGASESDDGHPLDRALERRAAERAAAADPASGRRPQRRQQRDSPPAAKAPRRRSTPPESGELPVESSPDAPSGAAAAAGQSAARRRRGGTSSSEPGRRGEEPPSGPEPGDSSSSGGSDMHSSEPSSSAGDGGTSSGAGSDFDAEMADAAAAGEASSEGEEEAAAVASLAVPAGPHSTPLEAVVELVGVTLVENLDGRNSEMQRLLRQPRYFDADYEEAGIRCFKCGGKGHMARDCSAPPRPRACFLCAQLGHDSRDCPNSLCWRCQRPGHMARDCPYGYSAAGWQDSAAACQRCGREDCPCAGERDHVRAEGGCTSDYLKSDLQHARCYVCGHRGHLSCGAAPPQPPKLSCCNCGQGGHTLEECPRELPPVLRNERVGGGRGRQQQQQQYSGRYSDQYGYGGGGGGGYHSHQQYEQRGSGRYGSGGEGQYASRYTSYSSYAEAALPRGRGGGSYRQEESGWSRHKAGRGGDEPDYMDDRYVQEESAAGARKRYRR